MFHIKFLETKEKQKLPLKKRRQLFILKFIPIFFFNFAVKAIYKTKLIFDFVGNNMDNKMLLKLYLFYVILFT